MKEDEVIIKTDSVRVRIMSLESYEAAEWHYHTEVSDDIFCLNGEIITCMKEPDEEFHLTPGKRVQVIAGKTHRLKNLGNEVARYLLIQGVGKYDFKKIEI